MKTVSRGYWVERARQCRAFATGQSSETVARRMLEFARRYDALAEGASGDLEDRPDDGWEEKVRRCGSAGTVRPGSAAALLCDAL